MWGPRSTLGLAANALTRSQPHYGATGGIEMRGVEDPAGELELDLYRVSELLNIPRDHLEACLAQPGVPCPPPALPPAPAWPASAPAPMSFPPAAGEGSDSPFGSWTGQSLLATLMGTSPQELLSADSPFPRDPSPHSHPSAPLEHLHHLIADPFPPSQPRPISSLRLDVGAQPNTAWTGSQDGGAKRRRVLLSVKYAEPVLAWALLILGVVGWSSMGPTYLLLPKRLQHRPLRVSVWRYGGGFLPFAGWAAWRWSRGGRARAEIERHLGAPSRWPQYAALSCSIFGGFLCYGLAVTYCNGMALAAGMSTINPFLQLLWEHSFSKPFDLAHLAALALATLAVLGMIFADRLHSMHGIAWAWASAVCYVMYVQCSEALSSQVPFFLIMVIIFGGGLFLSIIATFWFEGTTLGGGPESLFGFLDSHPVFWAVALSNVAFVLGLCGLTGCLRHVPPLVVAVAIAMEPAFAITMTVLSEEQSLPSPLMLLAVATLFAASLLLGTVVTLHGSEEVQVDITEAATWRR